MQAETEEHITKHRAQIEFCARALYDEETLTGDEFRRLWAEKAAADEVAQPSQTEGGADAQQ